MPQIVTIRAGSKCNFGADTGIVANQATTRTIQEFFNKPCCMVTITDGNVSVAYQPAIYALWLPNEVEFDLESLLQKLNAINTNQAKLTQTNTPQSVSARFAARLSSSTSYLNLSAFNTKAVAAQQSATTFVSEHRRDLVIGVLGFSAGALAVLAATKGSKLDTSALVAPKLSFKFR
jgi:malonyl CoA-acyl carrier protein transacylase